MNRIIQVTCLIVAVLLGAAQPACANTQARSLEERFTGVEQQLKRMDTIVSVGVVAAVICALWAQNTGRNAWLWFFAGLIFSVFSLLVMLYKNAEDIGARQPAARPPPGI